MKGTFHDGSGDPITLGNQTAIVIQLHAVVWEMSVYTGEKVETRTTTRNTLNDKQELWCNIFDNRKWDATQKCTTSTKVIR